MDAKARLERIISTAGPDASPSEIADALLAAGVTLPPQPAGPVTSEATAKKWLNAPNRPGLSAIEAARCDLDHLIPDLARDHGYVKAGEASPASEASLTPAEVERRARVWAYDYNLGPAHESALVAALTAPADTSAASTREAK